jgi:hypothetical protein
LTRRLRRSRGAALRELENRLFGAAGDRHIAGLGRALHGITAAEIIRPARRPYERADTTSNTYYDWLLAKRPVFLVAQATVGKFIETFKDFPPRQRPSTFTIDQAMEKLKQNLSN